MSRPFIFRINAAELFTHIQGMNNDEKASFITQLSIDFITLNGSFPYSKSIIDETLQFIEKKRENGLKGGRPKTETKAKVKLNKSKTKAKAKPEEETEEETEEEKEIKKEYAEKVLMTEKQHGTLIEKYGEQKTALMIQKLSVSKCANSKMKYDSDYHAILKWVVAAIEKEPQYSNLSKPLYAPGTPEYKAEFQKRLAL